MLALLILHQQNPVLPRRAAMHSLQSKSVLAPAANKSSAWVQWSLHWERLQKGSFRGKKGNWPGTRLIYFSLLQTLGSVKRNMVAGSIWHFSVVNTTQGDTLFLRNDIMRVIHTIASWAMSSKKRYFGALSLHLQHSKAVSHLQAMSWLLMQCSHLHEMHSYKGACCWVSCLKLWRYSIYFGNWLSGLYTWGRLFSVDADAKHALASSLFLCGPAGARICLLPAASSSRRASSSMVSDDILDSTESTCIKHQLIRHGPLHLNLHSCCFMLEDVTKSWLQTLE